MLFSMEVQIGRLAILRPTRRLIPGLGTMLATMLLGLLVSNVAAAQPAHKFPVAISDTGRYLVDANKKPWLMVGDAGWSSAVMLNQMQLTTYLDALARRGFNTIP